MIKSELVQRISEANPHLYQRDVENIVDAVLDEVTAALARGDRVELRGFGAFSTKSRPARMGRNMRTRAQGPHAARRRGDTRQQDDHSVLQDREENARAAEPSAALIVGFAISEVLIDA